MNRTTFDDGILRFHHDEKRGDYSISLNIHRIAAELDDEERIGLAKCLLRNLSYEDHIARAVIDRMLGDEGGWWASTDGRIRQELLTKIEGELASGYKWSWLGWLRDAIRDIHHEKRLYWMLYHDEEIGLAFRNWCRKVGIESNYTDKLDADAQAIIDSIEKAFEGLKAGLPIPEEPK